MKVLVCGKGQLGQELLHSCPAGIELLVHDSEELDITDSKSVGRVISSFRPDAIINAAAYTAVDKAETDIDNAWAVNCTGPENLLLEANKIGAYLLHISTDFVFDGNNARPYEPNHAVCPLGVYGQSKRAGELKIIEQGGDNWAILRTAWVFSAYGNNFVKTILRLAADKPKLTIIADQIGSPTWAAMLAQTCWEAIRVRLAGVHHCSCDGVASWFDFAIAIQEMAAERNLLSHKIPILPITTEQYPTPAKRPHYSVLDNSSLKQALPNAPRIYWRDALGQMLDELAN